MKSVRRLIIGEEPKVWKEIGIVATIVVREKVELNTEKHDDIFHRICFSVRASIREAIK